MALEIETRDGKLHIRLRVSPKAKRDRVNGIHAGAIKLQVKDPPEKGRANEGVVRLLAKTLQISAREIELVSGHTSQDKRVAISGVDEATLRTKLQPEED